MSGCVIESGRREEGEGRSLRWVWDWGKVGAVILGGGQLVSIEIVRRGRITAGTVGCRYERSICCCCC